MEQEARKPDTIKKLCLAIIFLLVAILGKATKTSAENRLDKWIDKLAWAESRNDETIKHLDSNNRYSYSCLQFQLDTFKAYVRKYHLEDQAEDAELENFIYDCPLQKKLAKMMITENYNNWHHWQNSVLYSGIGKPPK